MGGTIKGVVFEGGANTERRYKHSRVYLKDPIDSRVRRTMGDHLCNPFTMEKPTSIMHLPHTTDMPQASEKWAVWGITAD